MSTNDTVLLLASGASGVAPTEDDLARAVHAVCADLARQLVDDAEGASKTIAVEVIRAASEADAVDRRAGGRPQQPAQVRHPRRGPQLGPRPGRRRHHRRDVRARAARRVASTASGSAATVPPAEDRAKVDLSGRAVTIAVDLGAGDDEATVWTNDLTAAYVHENSAYST